MVRRTLAAAGARVGATLLLLLAAAGTAWGAPVVTAVASRMAHAGQVFDCPLPQVAPYGIECRNVVTSGMTAVVTFDQPVNAGAAAVQAGTATVNGAPTFSGNTMIIALTGVANAQLITLRLTNVSDTANPGAGVLASADVSFRVLLGDCNATGSITAGDVGYVKFFNGKAVDYSNYRADLNLTGTINSGDLAFTKSFSGVSVAGGAGPNTPPTISNISDQSTPAGTPMSSVAFTVGDGETPATNLSVSATSSDQVIVPNANIALGGQGASRNITVTPAASQAGVVTITVSVSDGLLITTDTFVLTVGTPTKLYLATLTPENSTVVTSGSGSATLTVNGAETQAVLRMNYSGLSTNKTGAHVHGPADPGQTAGIIFDIDTAAPDPNDGSFTWVFTQTGNTTVADIVNAIKTGRAYLNIHTAKYPNGELRGHFALATGSQTFTPPPAPPAIPAADLDLTNEPQATRNAVRFLAQASFGASSGTGTGVTDIAYLKTKGYGPWIDEQLAKPTTAMLPIIADRIKDSVNTNSVDGGRITDVWWNIALTGEDQLRQRVALAYSEVFVVSKVEESINAEPLGLASYHDMLANDAFVNFRQLLKDVTLHPIMGQYLNMRGNRKQSLTTSPKPNENYAREVLQLFSIGVNELHPDGTLRLDSGGLPIPTYDQSTIENFARVFTGWDVNTTYDYFDYWDTTTGTLKTGTNGTRTRYIKPMVVTASNHDFGTAAGVVTPRVLLQGSPINQVLPNRSSTATVAMANQDLDDALDNIFNHPNVGPFVARRLIQRMVCSNPSPGYIYRVASVFNDNGAGVRGDMGAVVKAVLTDYEARSGTMIGNQGFGKIKEPMLRIAQLIRALHPFTVGQFQSTQRPAYWRLPSSDTYLGQTVYRAPTVFNFFEPDYTVVQTLANSNNPNEKYDLPVNAPEMQILTENTAVYITRSLRNGIVSGPASGAPASNALGTGFDFGNGSYPASSAVQNPDVRIDLTYEKTLATTGASPDTHAAAVDRLLNHLNNLLMAGQMPASTGNDMRKMVRDYLINTPITDPLQRARIATYLVAASPQFTVQK